MDPVEVPRLLSENLRCEIAEDTFANWIVETARTAEFLEEYGSFWIEGRDGIAEELCNRLETFLLSFIPKSESWQKKNVKLTGGKIMAVMALYKPIIAQYEIPPQSVFRRLEGCHRNLFRVQAYAATEPKIVDLLECIVDTLELWFLKSRPDGYQLMSNCVIFLLAKPKLTGAIFKRLSSWSEYFMMFRRPWTKKDDAVPPREFFDDMEPPEWMEEGDHSEKASEEMNVVPEGPVLEVEKVDYLTDAVHKLFARPEACTLPEGRKFLTLLLTVNRDFMALARLGIHIVIMNDKLTQHLESLTEVLVKAWTSLNREENPLKLDLEAVIITDLMQRCLGTDPNQKKSQNSKYCMMVSCMYNSNDAYIRRMFHSNFDLMVLDGCKSDTVLTHTNAVRMLALCFPLLGPDVLKSQREQVVRDQVDIVSDNMKSIFPSFRAVGAEAAGEVLFRAWNLVPLAERTEMLRQLSERLIFDDTTPAVRVAATKAVGRILDLALARPVMLPVLIRMKDIATDESVPVRVEYYETLAKALKFEMHLLENGDKLVDSEQLLIHYTEKHHPYEAVLGKILDCMLWNLTDMRQFLKSMLKLYKTNTAVAVKFFHNVPKTKPAKEVHSVLSCIFSQVYLALNNRYKHQPDELNAVLTSGDLDSVNAALEIGGVIMAATVLVLSKDEKLNKDIQRKAVVMLKRAMSFSDSLVGINVYRIACRTGREQIPEYYDWCKAELEKVSDLNFETGIALITFLNFWGGTDDIIALANKWIKAENKGPSAARNRRGASEDDVKRAHLGLMFVCMLMADPDISGTFRELEEEVNTLVDTAVKAFVDRLPGRMTSAQTPNDPFRDTFYNSVLEFLGIVCVHRLRFNLDVDYLQRKCLDIVVCVRDNVCDKLGLSVPSNIILAIQKYKGEGKDLLKKSEVYAGQHSVVRIADRLVTTLKESIACLEDGKVFDLTDPDVHLLLRGYPLGTAPLQVTLVTPSDTPGLPAQNGHGNGPSRPRRTKK